MGSAGKAQPGGEAGLHTWLPVKLIEGRLGRQQTHGVWLVSDTGGLMYASRSPSTQGLLGAG